MNLYYTTITKEGSSQPKKELSLGGFKSSSQVPNGIIDNLFGSISQYSLEKQNDEFIALILKNETGILVTNIQLWVEYPIDEELIQTNMCKFEIGAVALNISNQMEHIKDRYCMPYNAEFYEANGIDNSVGLGDLTIDQSLGLWIKRSLIKDRIKDVYDLDKMDLDFQNKVESIIEENILMKISWD